MATALTRLPQPELSAYVQLLPDGVPPWVLQGGKQPSDTTPTPPTSAKPAEALGVQRGWEEEGVAREDGVQRGWGEGGVAREGRVQTAGHAAGEQVGMDRDHMGGTTSLPLAAEDADADLQGVMQQPGFRAFAGGWWLLLGGAVWGCESCGYGR